ncbi:phospholipase D [Reticulomyxa filosa]|uniref:Phospholipase D n=1 Tax=Reticulomyxa filosa TaxID=46433 RepID=X6MI45_RETFI|nr:phospholipase D [Reticulomyxa filosa]|eukprot:ETO13539.1 phospholipase D [Reticulomyxa filosa]
MRNENENDITDRKTLIPLGNVSLENKIEFYHHGDSFFRRLWDDIENAKSQILFETYIMNPDAVGIRTIDLLTKACQRGVNVTLIIDGFGGSQMTASHFVEFQKAGGIVLFYNPLHVSRWFSKMVHFENLMLFAYRNHKKCVVIDSKIGYTGGMNISGEYCSPAINGGINKFRDTHCRLQGSVVGLLQDAIYYSIIDIDPQITEENNIELENLRKKEVLVNRNKKSSGVFFLDTFYIHGLPKATSQPSDSNSKERLTDGTWPSSESAPYSTWQQWKQRHDARSSSHPFPLMPSVLRHRYDNSIERFQKWLQRHETPQMFSDKKIQWKTDKELEDIEKHTNPTNLSKVVRQAKASVYGNEEKLVEETEEELIHRVHEDDTHEYEHILKTKIKSEKEAQKEIQNQCDTYIQVLESYRETKMRNIQNALQSAIDHSLSHVFVMNPYFLPPRKLKKALINASLRNVDVRIITCDQSDVWMVSLASRHIYEELLQYPHIRLFEYSKKVLHGKMVLIDDIFVSIGSFNFDDWSHARNLEMNLMIADPKCGETIREQFMLDLNDCKEVKLEDVKKRHWYQKWLYWIAYTGSRMIDKIFLKVQQVFHDLSSILFLCTIFT